ncbi:MAG: L-2-amino-thiazoline-4-carboxylic acid hydrolase [Acidobacteria bacterium]|nr:L-2-amino-thiazoline-4-carboxylic acid hydrolase [Acidobacteriota bacterium]
MNNESQRTLEQVYRSAVSGLYSRLRSNYEFLHRRFGDDGLKLIAEMSHEYGITVAQRAKARLESNDLHSVAQYLLRIFDTVARGRGLISTIQDDPDRVIITVDRCPLDFTMPEMCAAHTEMEKAVVEELNPGLTYRIGKSIPAGHHCCEHIVEKKQ